MNRRSCLQVLAAAPIAALVPWRPPVDHVSRWLMAWDVGRGPSRTVWVWIRQDDMAGRIVRVLGETNRILDEMPWVEGPRYVRATYVGDGRTERVVASRFL